MPGLVGAVEAGGTKFVLALARPDGTVIERTRIDTQDGQNTLRELTAWFAAAQARHGSIDAFGIASFGPIGIDPGQADYGTFLTTVKPGWQGASFTQALAGFDVPVKIDTDVNGAALGEALAGAGRGRRVVAYTTVGTGIGSGIVKDGAVVTGLSHFETGHLRPPHDLSRDPFEGSCPYHGDCCEGLASGTAIRARWDAELGEVTDPQAVALIGHYLGHLAATLAAFHMPEVFIFGGGVMKTPGLLEALRTTMRQSLAGYLAYYDRDLDEIVVAPELGDDAGITGAISLGRQAMEKTPS
ncbi:ROK family protein [Erythrobacter mangrovi]|uniref:ROK family protein n=1 Tax=Erythrobacter mangrovi TaxID=2739433 RepID=A0A7D4CP02_9SPHN|nr:ROK family protein [Erythrobacter mangrovi]QKG72448.1 ROK family protein [Erythrobacter mangrovi]